MWDGDLGHGHRLSLSQNIGAGQMGLDADMGSDGFHRILTGCSLFGPAKVRPAPSETHDFKGLPPDSNRTLTGCSPDSMESG